MIVKNFDGKDINNICKKNNKEEIIDEEEDEQDINDEEQYGKSQYDTYDKKTKKSKKVKQKKDNEIKNEEIENEAPQDDNDNETPQNGNDEKTVEKIKEFLDKICDNPRCIGITNAINIVKIQNQIESVINDKNFNLANVDNDIINCDNINDFIGKFNNNLVGFNTFLDKLVDNNSNNTINNSDYYDNDMIKNENYFSFLKDTIDRSTFLTLNIKCRKGYLKDYLCKQVDANDNYIVLKCCGNNIFQREHINLLQNFLMNDLKLNVNIDCNVYNTNILALTKCS